MADNTSTNLSKIERDELIAICEKLRGNSSDPNTEADINRLITFIRSRKYGLMFEKHEEEVDRLLKDHLPAFYDVEDKTIKTKDTEDCNFLLEGDNLHSLKLLEKTHKGKIDVIYIDPPYNTGNKDFIYADNMVGQDDGFRHSKWLSFMKERLEIARELLSNEGVIFISIDDNEQAQLKLLCDGIFGEQNFLNTLIFKKSTGKNDSKFLATLTEYVVCYRKNSLLEFNKKDTDTESYKYEDANGRYALEKLDRGGLEYRVNCDYIIMSPENTPIFPGADEKAYEDRKNGGAKSRDWIWRYNRERFDREIEAGNIEFKKSKNGWSVYTKRYITGVSKSPYSNLYDCENNSIGNKQIKSIFGDKIFSFPKPLGLITFLVKLHPNSSATVLDFFAGSGTTGQAVLELNQEDGGDRHFILCTNNENNICEEVTYQRLKTVITGIRPDGTKYSDGIKANLKYFKTDMVAFDDDELEDKLINSSECLMQIENSALLSSPEIDIAYCDEELPDVFANKPNLKTLYILEDVLFNAEQTSYIESHNIEIKRIADCYYQGV